MADSFLVTPESLGFDSARLVRLFEHIQEQRINMHSLMISRSGKTVLDANFYPYHPAIKHDIRSVTKTVMSILVGIALDEGLIGSVNQPILDFFPMRQIANLDARKKAITVAHLLSMTSGLAQTDSDTGLMIQSPDWVQYTLNGPMAAEPGTVFNYSTGNYHLLSAIVQLVTGKSALNYARQKLFGPLGIEGMSWASDPQGITTGGMGLRLITSNLLKLGQLYVQRGTWNGQQIVSPAWVDASTTPYKEHYGYGWWIDVFPGSFNASGYSGRLVFVIPRYDLVVVIVGGIPDSHTLAPTLLEQFIIPAASSLPENPVAVEQLTTLIQAAAHPQPAGVPSLPQMAQAVTNRRYRLEANPIEWEAFTLFFEGDTAKIWVQIGGNEADLAIGLDQLARSTPVTNLSPLAENEPVALRGIWEDNGTFLLHLYIVGSSENWSLRLWFDDDRVAIRLVDQITGHTDDFDGWRDA
jgi:CubicO group peptidase (beta-lactamase class C family)